MPSRRVVSYSWIFVVNCVSFPVAKRRASSGAQKR